MATIYSPPAMSDEFLRDRQRSADAIYFDRVYGDLPEADQKVRHIRQWLGFTCLELVSLKNNVTDEASIAQALAGEIVPDLAIYRTQIANTLTIDVAKATKDYQPEPLDLTAALERATIAGGTLDLRHLALERGGRHTDQSRRRVRSIVLPQLHLAAAGLALAYDLGPVNQLHAKRLEHLCTHTQTDRL